MSPYNLDIIPFATYAGGVVQRAQAFKYPSFLSQLLEGFKKRQEFRRTQKTNYTRLLQNYYRAQDSIPSAVHKNSKLIFESNLPDNLKESLRRKIEKYQEDLAVSIEKDMVAAQALFGNETWANQGLLREIITDWHLARVQGHLKGIQFPHIQVLFDNWLLARSLDPAYYSGTLRADLERYSRAYQHASKLINPFLRFKLRNINFKPAKKQQIIWFRDFIYTLVKKLETSYERGLTREIDNLSSPDPINIPQVEKNISDTVKDDIYGPSNSIVVVDPKGGPITVPAVNGKPVAMADERPTQIDQVLPFLDYITNGGLSKDFKEGAAANQAAIQEYISGLASQVSELANVMQRNLNNAPAGKAIAPSFRGLKLFGGGLVGIQTLIVAAIAIAEFLETGTLDNSGIYQQALVQVMQKLDQVLAKEGVKEIPNDVYNQLKSYQDSLDQLKQNQQKWNEDFRKVIDEMKLTRYTETKPPEESKPDRTGQIIFGGSILVATAAIIYSLSGKRKG